MANQKFPTSVSRRLHLLLWAESWWLPLQLPPPPPPPRRLLQPQTPRHLAGSAEGWGHKFSMWKPDLARAHTSLQPDDRISWTSALQRLVAGDCSVLSTKLPMYLPQWAAGFPVPSILRMHRRCSSWFNAYWTTYLLTSLSVCFPVCRLSEEGSGWGLLSCTQMGCMSIQSPLSREAEYALFSTPVAFLVL